MSKLEPITPGEILLEEFLKPMVLASIVWPRKLVFPLSVSVRLLQVSVRSQLIPIYGCVGSLVYPTAIGCALRLPTIRRLQSALLAHR